MPSENTEAGALSRRLERLTAAVAALSVGFALAVVWALLPRTEVVARRFLLVDDGQHWRGALALDESASPTVRLNDVSGRAVLYGVIRPDGTPRLRLSDAGGRNRIVLEVGADGSPRVQLLDANGRTGVDARLAADGRPELDVRWGSEFRHLTLPDSTGAGGGPAR